MRIISKKRLKLTYYYIIVVCSIYFLISLYNAKVVIANFERIKTDEREIASTREKRLESRREQRMDTTDYKMLSHKQKRFLALKASEMFEDKSDFITSDTESVLNFYPCNEESSNCSDLKKNASTLSYGRNDTTEILYNEGIRQMQSSIPSYTELVLNTSDVNFISTNLFQAIRLLTENSSEVLFQINDTSLHREPIYVIVSPDCNNCSEFFSQFHQKGYSGRVLIENVSLPISWNPSNEFMRRLEKRRNRVKQVCHDRQLDLRSPFNKPNAWEFIIEPKHGLVWCNVFKAASSTWLYNFNTLAGYPESFLLHAKDTPISLARKKYPRPTIKDLDKALNSTSRSVAFMISRHPLERLVSAYRDKFMSRNRFYRNLSERISLYQELPQSKLEKTLSKEAENKSPNVPQKHAAPSFQQFIQFVIDSHDYGLKLDEHWRPMYQFCSPCLVDFDVYAKVETLEEDGNYIIFKSGIQDIIHQKRINRSKDKPTITVAESYFCQLSSIQRKKVFQIYQIDMEIFDYSFAKYNNCSGKK